MNRTSRRHHRINPLRIYLSLYLSFCVVLDPVIPQNQPPNEQRQWQCAPYHSRDNVHFNQRPTGASTKIATPSVEELRFDSTRIHPTHATFDNRFDDPNRFDLIFASDFSGTYFLLYDFVDYFEKDGPSFLQRDKFKDIIHTIFKNMSELVREAIIFQVNPRTKSATTRSVVVCLSSRYHRHANNPFGYNRTPPQNKTQKRNI